MYRVDEDFSPGLEARGGDLLGMPFGFWVRRGGFVVGGAVLLPNAIGDLFLTPPFEDSEVFLRALLPLLRGWSKPGRAILAQGISGEHVPAFLASGFELDESRRWMIRPTGPEEIRWNGHRVEPIEEGSAAAVADLLHRSFCGAPSEYGRRDRNAFAASVGRWFAAAGEGSPERHASAVVTGASGRPHAACLVNLHKGLPTIQFVATDPERRGRGMASVLIRRAVDQLRHHYAWVKLSVTTETPAERLYRRLGFRGGPEVANLVLASADEGPERPRPRPVPR